MVRITLCGIASCLMLSPALGQKPGPPELTQQQADSRTVLGVVNEYLAAGAEAIRAKEYDEGIRLTKLGLDRPNVAARSGGGFVESVRRACRQERAGPRDRLLHGVARHQRHELARLQQSRVRLLLETHVRAEPTRISTWR